MFRKGGSANSGIMDGLDRKGYYRGGSEPWSQLAEIYNVPTVDQESLIEAYTHGGEPQWLKNLRASQIKKREEAGTDTTARGWETGKDLPTEYPDLSETKWEEGPPGGTQLPYYERKKDDGGLDSIPIAEVKETVSDKNKKYLKMMAPHMQKRMMADALGAASEAFGESTGDTKQDIANAISAAAAGMGGTKDIYDKVTMLTLQGEIAKDIKAAEKVKPSNFESAVSAWRNIKDEKGDPKYSLEEALEKASGKQTESARFYEIQEKFGKGEAIADQHKDNPQFWGSYSKMDKKELKKLPDDAIGKYIYDETENSFYSISVNDEGEKEAKFLKRA